MKVGDKYVIEIEEIIRGYGNAEDDHVHEPIARIKGFNALVFDKYGLEKLEPYDGEKVYLKGYKDGMKAMQDAEIKVGDEVYSDAFDDKGIVTHITADKVACVCIICNGSTMMKVGTNGLHKTGRHFDAIAEVLAELRGEE